MPVSRTGGVSAEYVLMSDRTSTRPPHIPQVHASRAARPAHQTASHAREETDTPEVPQGASCSLCPPIRLWHCHRTCSPWTMPRSIPAPSVAHGNGAKASPPLSAPPVGIGMARHPRRSWSSRRTQNDQRPPPPSSAAGIAPQSVLLPMHLQRQGAERVTIDLARATVPASPR
jgi:hypothetical protein